MAAEVAAEFAEAEVAEAEVAAAPAAPAAPAPATPAAPAAPASHKQFQRLATDKRFQQAAHRSKHHPSGFAFLFQWTAHHPGVFVSLCAFLETCPDGPFRGSFRLAITIQVTAEAVPSATVCGIGGGLAGALQHLRQWRGNSCL